MTLGMLPWKPNEATKTAITAHMAWILWGLINRLAWVRAGQMRATRVMKTRVFMAKRTRLRWSTAFVQENTKNPRIAVNRNSGRKLGSWILK